MATRCLHVDLIFFLFIPSTAEEISNIVILSMQIFDTKNSAGIFMRNKRMLTSAFIRNYTGYKILSQSTARNHVNTPTVEKLKQAFQLSA